MNEVNEAIVALEKHQAIIKAAYMKLAAEVDATIGSELDEGQFIQKVDNVEYLDNAASKMGAAWGYLKKIKVLAADAAS